MSSKDAAEAVLMVVRRIIKWIALGFFGFIAFIFIFIYGNNYYSQWQQRIKVTNSMDGITLDEQLSDVLFKNADFEKIINNNSQLVEYGNSRVSVVIEQGKVKEIIHHCGDGELLYDNLNQISCGYSSESIKEKYSDNLEIYCKQDNSRIYFAPKYHAIYYLKSNKVTQMTLTKSGQKQASWIDCSNVIIN
jgi:hypothetical protein